MSSTSKSAVPTFSEQQAAKDQRLPTADEGQVPYATPPLTGKLLGGDLPADLSGMAAESQEITFNRVGVAALNSAIMLVKDHRDAAVDDLNAERKRTNDLSQRLSEAEKSVAVLETKLRAERQSSSFRLVVGGLGSSAIGFIPFAAEKFGGFAGFIVGVFGAVLLVTAAMLKPRDSK